MLRSFISRKSKHLWRVCHSSSINPNKCPIWTAKLQWLLWYQMDARKGLYLKRILVNDDQLNVLFIKYHKKLIHTISNYNQRQIYRNGPKCRVTIVLHSLNSYITYCNIIRQRHSLFSLSWKEKFNFGNNRNSKTINKKLIHCDNFLLNKYTPMNYCNIENLNWVATYQSDSDIRISFFMRVDTCDWSYFYSCPIQVLPQKF